jgi:polyisoprenoid-binding protein YceI
MKKLILRCLLVGMFFQTSFAVASEIDVKKSQLQWFAEKVVTDKKHNGLISIKSGKVEFKDGQPVLAEIVLDMTSLSNVDIESPKYKKKFEGHLNSADFFDTAKFPTAKIVADKFTAVDKSKFNVVGKLTIKGITQPIAFVGLLKEAGGTKSVDAQFEFNRAKFNVQYGSGAFFKGLGDKLISDTVKVKGHLVLSK